MTTLCDMYFYEDEVEAVVDELGMRGVLANAHFDVTAGTDTDGALGQAEQFVARWRGHPRIVPALGPHAPYSVGPELYRALHALAERLDVLVVTHLAETQGRIATSVAVTAVPLSATSRTSVSWTAGWSPPTVFGSTARRLTSWQPPVRAWSTILAAT